MIGLTYVLHLENGRNTPTSEVGGSGERVDYFVITQLSWAFGVSAVAHEGKGGGSFLCVLHLGVWIVSFTCCAQTDGPPNVALRPEFANPCLLSLMEENHFGELPLCSALSHGGKCLWALDFLGASEQGRVMD